MKENGNEKREFVEEKKNPKRRLAKIKDVGEGYKKREFVQEERKIVEKKEIFRRQMELAKENVVKKEIS